MFSFLTWTLDTINANQTNLLNKCGLNSLIGCSTVFLKFHFDCPLSPPTFLQQNEFFQQSATQFNKYFKL